MPRLTPLTRRINNLASLQQKLACEGFHADFERMQTLAIEEISRILNVEACSIILFDETNKDWLKCKSLIRNSEWNDQLIPRDGSGLTQECLLTAEIIRENETIDNPHLKPSNDGPGNIQVHSMICIPLKLNGQVLGAIRVINKIHGDFDIQDQDLLSIIANQVANTLYLTHLYKELKTVKSELDSSRSNTKESINILWALSDNLPVSFYVINPDFKLIAVNRSRIQLTDKTSNSLVGQLCYKALFDHSKPCSECRVNETFQYGQNTQRYERRKSLQEESNEWEVFTYPILDENGQIHQALLLEQNITEKRRLETILAQSEKLAAVGQLAAGVAHEINNPLTAIIANAQMLHRELPLDHDLQESVDLIARAGARAAQVVRNLLDFARKEEYSLRLTDLNETVERALELIQHEFLARGIDLEFKEDPYLPSILASQDHLQSVWLNLLLNAMDSLDKSPGEINIDTQKVGNEIQVTFTDNGKGIQPENLTQIFEPFYTTKAPGRGTGLGLSVSHRIIKQHGGHIRVESQVGLGSKFTVILPTP